MPVLEPGNTPVFTVKKPLRKRVNSSAIWFRFKDTSKLYLSIFPVVPGTGQYSSYDCLLYIHSLQGNPTKSLSIKATESSILYTPALHADLAILLL